MIYIKERYNVKHTDFFEYITTQITKLKDIQIIKKEISDFHDAADSILHGKMRARVMPDFGPIYWEQEEASYLSISRNKK